VDPDERIRRMEERGVVTPEQAAMLRASLSTSALAGGPAAPPPRRARMTAGLLAAGALAAVAAVVILASITPEAARIDDVSQTINRVGGHGEMNRSLSAVLGIGILIVVPLLVWVFTHNSLVNREERVFEAWADTESNMQRRADLIPALVDTVSRYLEHERGTFTEVSGQRATALKEAKASLDELIRASRDAAELMRQRGAAAVEDETLLRTLAEAEARMGAGISTVMAVAESYPELRSSDQFLELQGQLEGTENRINVARMRFNEAVRAYNAAIRYLPGSLVASLGNFHRKAYFQSTDEAKLVPALAFQ
jgi:LemA protein